MPEILTYDQMDVELLRKTPYPAELVALAMQITMKSDPIDDIPLFTEKKAKFLWYAEHRSLFEHVQYTFLIQNVSRSFLGQITRQRTASPTSGSQHYQDYSDYPVVISKKLKDTELAEVNFGNSFGDYHHAIYQLDVPREEARQLLPMGATVTYLWTIDALNLAKFLRQRMCNRNVLEMRIFANRVLDLVIDHFPELFNFIGPQCCMGECHQGFLVCEEKIYVNPESDN
jgi:thymidylate synthase (FAD)